MKYGMFIRMVDMKFGMITEQMIIIKKNAKNAMIIIHIFMN